jgi:hypothetical protein
VGYLEIKNIYAIIYTVILYAGCSVSSCAAAWYRNLTEERRK